MSQLSTTTWRPPASTLEDLYDFVQLVDWLGHLHRFCRPIVATDVEDAYEHAMSIANARLAGTLVQVSDKSGRWSPDS